MAAPGGGGPPAAAAGGGGGGGGTGAGNPGTDGGNTDNGGNVISAQPVIGSKKGQTAIRRECEQGSVTGALQAWSAFRTANPDVTPEFTTLQMLLTVPLPPLPTHELAQIALSP
jgi:hypothetical protein